MRRRLEPARSRRRAACRRRIAARPSSASPSNATAPARPTPPPWVQSLIADIQRYLAGQQVDFSAIAVDLDGIDDFRQQTLRGAARRSASAAPHLRRTGASRLGSDRLGGRPRRRRGDGAKSDADRDPVPPRARRRQQARRLLGLRRHRAPSRNCWRSKASTWRRRPTPRRGCRDCELFPIVSTIRPRTLRSLMSRKRLRRTARADRPWSAAASIFPPRASHRYPRTPPACRRACACGNR